MTVGLRIEGSPGEGEAPAPDGTGGASNEIDAACVSGRCGVIGGVKAFSGWVKPKPGAGFAASARCCTRGAAPWGRMMSADSDTESWGVSTVSWS